MDRPAVPRASSLARVALVFIEDYTTPGMPRLAANPQAVTADFAYIRFLGSHREMDALVEAKAKGEGRRWDAPVRDRTRAMNACVPALRDLSGRGGGIVHFRTSNDMNVRQVYDNLLRAVLAARSLFPHLEDLAGSRFIFEAPRTRSTSSRIPGTTAVPTIHWSHLPPCSLVDRQRRGRRQSFKDAGEFLVDDSCTKLVTIDGPLRGSTIPLVGQEIVIGREGAADVCVPQSSVSRKHCSIALSGGRFRLRDLASRNGTFVNGIPVTERVLENGDRISVGDSVFLFVTEPRALPASPAVMEEGDLEPQTTLELDPRNSLYLHPGKTAGAAPLAERTVRNLDLLLTISTAVSSIRSPETLQDRILEWVLDAVPAERAGILLTGAGPDSFGSVMTKGRGAAPGPTVHVSRTIALKVAKEGIALLSNDVRESEAYDQVKSLAEPAVRSVICVPLAAFDRVNGVIYLDTSSQAQRFDEDHLELVTAIAGIAAVALENAVHLEWLESETRRLQVETCVVENMVGDSPRIREVFGFIESVAPTDVTVLIRGETGTGKELVARAIHANSARSSKPFVAISCAALPEALLENELFGHERGAFTGADMQKKGKLEVADGGTVFLDEVSEISMAAQAKLLRVLQEREFERVGGTRTVKVDVRLIAATNRDLQARVREGAFRQDLYYRLDVVSVIIPPLRERRGDIPLLANALAAKHARLLNRSVSGLSPQARACLMSYDWPGNVRELENAIERAVVLGKTNLIRPEDLPEAVLESELPSDEPIARYHDATLKFKKKLILDAIAEAGGSQSKAAEALGLHPTYLSRLIRNMNLKAELKE